MKTILIIMAGGLGERFWPKCRSNEPKQFLSLTSDGKTLIQLTAERNLPIVDYNDMFIVTNKKYVDLVHEQLPGIPIENILAEPIVKNTAPCIGLAAAVLKRKYKDAVVLVVASDHLIKNEEIYVGTMLEAIKAAKEDSNIITIGITPSYPETGYGYIHFELKKDENRLPGMYHVKRFVEKPDIELAKEYLSSGQYFWNSGMFVWKLSTIMDKFKELLPDMYQGLVKIGQAFGTNEYEDVLYQCYSEFDSISIDRGIMERSEHIYTMPGNFGWDDVGSWLALGRINKTNDLGNMVQGDVITIDTKNTIIVSNKKLIASVGLKDMVVIATSNWQNMDLLACH